MQPDTLHFVHSLPEQIPDGQPLGGGLFWGGDFEVVTNLIKSNQLDVSQIRFFVGYSGWAEGQLEDEMKEKSWLTVVANPQLVFSTEVKDIWKKAVKELDKSYHQIINYPIDPQLN